MSPIGRGSGPDRDEMSLSELTTMLTSLGLTQADLVRMSGTPGYKRGSATSVTLPSS